MKLSPKFAARKAFIFPVVLALVFLASNIQPTQAARRPGAPRMIRFDWSDGSSRDNSPGSLLRAGIVQNAPTSVFQGVFNTRQPREGTSNWTLYFTGESNGTRNLWQAVPDESEAKAPSEVSNEDAERGSTRGSTRGSSEAAMRNVVWRATPLTRFSDGFFAEQAAPLPDGRSLLCVTNATDLRGNNSPHTQIARLDLNSGALTALTKNTSRNHSPAVTSDGRRFAFVSERDGASEIYVMPIEGGTAWRVTTMAQHPSWLDDSTLVFESTRPGQIGLYKIIVPENFGQGARDSRAQRFYTRHGEATLSSDGAVLAIASQTAATAPDGSRVMESRLSILAGDGSGERSIPGTEGARAPAFAADGSAIIFDAPVASEREQSTDPKAPRALWLLPMMRVAPVANLLGARRVSKEVTATANNGLTKLHAVEVLGTAFAEDMVAPKIKLELSEGKEPETWKSLPMQQQPVHEGVLTTLLLAMDEPEELTLRLTVTDDSGDTSQSTLTLTLPLEVAQPGANAPIFAATFPVGVLPSPGAPGATAPSAPPATLLPAPVKAPLTAQPPRLPLPAPPPRVRTNLRPPDAPVTAVPGEKPPVAIAMAPVPVLPLPSLPPAPGSVAPSPTPLPNPNWIPAPPAPGIATSPTVPATGQALPALPGMGTTVRYGTPRRNSTARTAKPGADAGRVIVRGTPAVMAAGENILVTATLRNTGKQAWASHGAQPVRLIYRWINEGSGSRTRWALTWLRQPIPPGGTAQLSFSLVAPPRPGRYRLTYSLLRLSGTEYEPPPFKARQDRWPGEFGGITYAVVVR